MSTLTPVWTEDMFREALRNLDRKLGTHTADYNIVLTHVKSYYGQCWYGQKFVFNMNFFNSPNHVERNAIDTIRHEYVHMIVHQYRIDKIFNDTKPHGKAFKSLCRYVNALPQATSRESDYTPITKEEAERLLLAEDLTGKSIDAYLADLKANPPTPADRGKNPESDDPMIIIKCMHIFTSVISPAPGCESEGKKRYECILCHKIKTETLPALGHNYSSWVYAGDGKEKRSCSRCGNVQIRNAPVRTPPQAPQPGQPAPAPKPKPYVPAPAPVQPVQKPDNKETAAKTPSRGFAGFTVIVHVLMCITAILTSIASTFEAGTAPVFLKIFDFGISRLAPVWRALVQGLVIHFPMYALLPLDCLLERKKVLSGETIDACSGIVGGTYLLNVITSAIMIFVFSELPLGMKFLNAGIISALVIFLFIAQALGL